MKRLFTGLRGKPPDRSYDAVIIGAGIGGLICANLLAREGLRVLLVEQHYMVGGYCSTFRRAGYTFDAATHFYPLLGNTNTITGRLLPDLDVPELALEPERTFKGAAKHYEEEFGAQASAVAITLGLRLINNQIVTAVGRYSDIREKSFRNREKALHA